MSTTPKPVHSVNEITDLVLFRTVPPILYVRAAGQVNSTGWTGGMLVPRVYVTKPADGIQEFDFVATPPDGVVLWMFTDIQGEAVMNDLPDWAVGVRIVAETNSVEQRFPMAAPALTDPGDADDRTEAPQALLAPPHDTAEPEPLLIAEAEGYEAAAIEGTTCFEFQVASMNIPETKTEWEVRCIATNPFNGKCIAKTKVPIIYRRTSKLRLLARVCAPDGEAIFDHVKDCVQQAIIAGVAVGVLSSGNLAAAAAALKAYLIACLKGKLGDVIGDITVDLRREKITGVWKKL